VLQVWLAERGGRGDQPLFPTRTGRRLSTDAVERLVRQTKVLRLRPSPAKASRDRSHRGLIPRRPSPCERDTCVGLSRNRIWNKGIGVNPVPMPESVQPIRSRPLPESDDVADPGKPSRHSTISHCRQLAPKRSRDWAQTADGTPGSAASKPPVNASRGPRPDTVSSPRTR
jgi:hypothetical protein